MWHGPYISKTRVDFKDLVDIFVNKVVEEGKAKELNNLLGEEYKKTISVISILFHQMNYFDEAGNVLYLFKYFQMLFPLFLFLLCPVI